MEEYQVDHIWAERVVTDDTTLSRLVNQENVNSEKCVSPRTVHSTRCPLPRATLAHMKYIPANKKRIHSAKPTPALHTDQMIPHSPTRILDSSAHNCSALTELMIHNVACK